MIRIFRKTIKGKKLQELRELKSGSWIDITEATTEEIRMVADLAELELADVDDVLDDYESPRIEKHEKSTVLFIRTPSPKNSLMETDVLMIVLTEKYLITISTRKNRYIKNILKNKGLPPTTQQAKFLGYLLLSITQGYTRRIKKISEKAMIKRKELKTVGGSDIVDLTSSEAVLNQYLTALKPMRDLFEVLLKGKHVSMYAEDKDLYEDLFNSINQSVGVCASQAEEIGSLRDTYQTILTNDLNKTMKFLASFTVLLTIPTLISSIFGMNISLPMEGNSMAFWILMLVMFLVLLLLFSWFKRKKWF